MRKTQLIFTFITAIFFCMNVQAQQTGKISGTVKSADDKPIDAATVSLLKSKDSSLVKIAVSDKTGLYEFEKIKTGSYIIKAESVGYTALYSNSFEITETNSSIQIPDLKMTVASTQLNNVSVAAHRPLIENKIDKTVVNVDASPTNGGLSALEVLEKSPGISVDNDGNVSLKGKPNVMILVDGKQTYLNAQDLANYLRNMPANQLDQIEIMTQPPAKYDASGNAGIINIITKKNKANGFNGTFSNSAIIAQYFKNTNSLNINWRKNKVNLYGSYGYSYWEGFNDININRSLRDSAGVPYNRYVNQHTYGRYSDRAQSFKAGMDFFADKKTTFGFVMTGTLDHQSFTSNGRANIYDSLHNFVQYNTATSQNTTPLTNLGFTLTFDKKLNDKGGDLSAEADYIFYTTPGFDFSNNYLFNADNTPSTPPYDLSGQLPSHINIGIAKVDYSQPLKHGVTFETGLKSSIVKTDNDAEYSLYNNANNKWEPDDTISNHFIYKENINAAYINLKKQWKKFGAQLGLRGEQTVSNGVQVVNDTPIHKNYFQLFPTTYLSYTPNDKNTFSLSYGRRIDRPDYQDLNPFQLQLDRYTYLQGNPNLQPQFSNNIELSYNYNSHLNITANYTTISDIINDVLITTKDPQDSNYTTFQTKKNIASNRNVGLAISYNNQIKKWWAINLYGSVYNNKYNGVITGDNINVNITAFSANMSSQFTFNKGWGAEISGWYNSKDFVSSAILAHPMGMFSLGASKTIFKGKGSIKLNLRDPFYLLYFQGTTTTDQGTTFIHSTWDNRRAIITFTYRFGKNTQQVQHKDNGASDEQNRVKTGGGQQ
jgi:outer membrane receptor protein involved in Fe transport